MKPLLALGFRPFYLLGTAFAVVALIAWLGAYTGGIAISGYLAGTAWHSHEMLFGFLAAVMAGFLLTAVRNWTGLPTPAGWPLAGIALLWLVARILLPVGPVFPAILVDVAFLPVVTAAIAVPILRSRNARNVKVIVIMAALSVIHALYHVAMRVDAVPVAHARAALFAFLGVVAILFALVGGRVIPAFTRNAVPGSNPRHNVWVESLAFGSLVLIVALILSGTAVPARRWIVALLFIVAAVAHGVRLALWQPHLTFRNPLLWMLPVAYSWLPLAFLLAPLHMAGLVPAGAWVHALSAGAFSGMMMAMMMRSSLGHTGRPLAASRSDIAAFLLLQLAAVSRVLAGTVGDYRTMVLVAGGLWALAFAALLARYLPIWLRPRADGKPG